MMLRWTAKKGIKGGREKEITVWENGKQLKRCKREEKQGESSGSWRPLGSGQCINRQVNRGGSEEKIKVTRFND